MNYNLIKPVVYIPLYDLCLCILFTKKARWFQLHSLTNLIIVNIIKNDVYNLVTRQQESIQILDDYEELYYIIVLHLYHMLFFKNTLMDYFHHIVFVLFGTIPIYYYYNINLIRLASFVGCGLPGVIEYFTLSLVKHNKISSLNQKILISNIYNYFRYPLGIYACSSIIIYYQQGYTPNIDIYTLIYTVFMIFFNGAYFNKLTIENKTWHSLSIRPVTN